MCLRYIFFKNCLVWFALLCFALLCFGLASRIKLQRQCNMFTVTLQTILQTVQFHKLNCNAVTIPNKPFCELLDLVCFGLVSRIKLQRSHHYLINRFANYLTQFALDWFHELNCNASVICLWLLYKPFCKLFSFTN